MDSDLRKTKSEQERVDTVEILHNLSRTEKPWFLTPHLVKLNLLLLSGLLSQATSGFDGSMLNGLQSLPQWADYFEHPKGSRLSAIANGTIFGVLAAMFVASWICEKFGRRYPLTFGSGIMIIGSILQGAAQNYAIFVIARLIIGFGLGIVQVCAPLLVSETTFPSHRGKMTAIWDSSWPLGSLIASWVTFGTFHIPSTWSWRIPSILQGLPSLIQFVLSLMVPESPRWLIYNDRNEDAFKVLTKYHAGGDLNSELVRFEISEIAATIELEKLHGTGSWKEWIITKGNIRRLARVVPLSFAIQWCGNGITSYYLTILLNTIGITSSKTQLIINGCLSITGFVIAIICALSIDRFGRRTLFIFAFSGMLTAFLIWTILSAINQERDFKDKKLSQGVVAMLFIFMVAYHFAAPTVPTYIMEISKYSLRSKASMLYQLCGNLAGVFNTFANPVAMEAIEWKYYIVYCCLLAVYLILTILYIPETKGRTLEEVSILFDGAEAINENCDATIQTEELFDEKVLVRHISHGDNI